MLILARIILHFACAAPLFWLLAALTLGDETALGADPIKELGHFLGKAALIIFCVMFLLGIVLELLQRNGWQILRRPIGLWACFWATLHLASYFLLELNRDTALFVAELTTRPNLILGAIAWLILLILSLTSLSILKQRLGKRWFSLHQLAYVAIICAGIHYYWSVKSLTIQPLVITGIITLILIWRIGGKRLIVGRKIPNGAQ